MHPLVCQVSVAIFASSVFSDLWQEKRGSSDGTFRKTRYFVCQDDYGTFLPANQILAVPNSTSGPPVKTGTHKTRLLSAERSKSDRNFYLDDAVVVFDNDGRRVPGVVKWTVPGINCEKDGYIIGIETVRGWQVIVANLLLLEYCLCTKFWDVYFAITVWVKIFGIIVKPYFS